jgi:biotin operon repressor BirA-like protein
VSAERDLLVRLQAGPASGDALARASGQTRAAVWKRIEALRAAGVAIDARPGRGYALASPVELLDADAAGCNDESIADVSFDDHLGDIEVPVLYVGGNGGIGSLGICTTTLLGSQDVTSLIVDLQPPAGQLAEFGHADIFLANNAQSLVWQPILSCLAVFFGSRATKRIYSRYDIFDRLSGKSFTSNALNAPSNIRQWDLTASYQHDIILIPSHPNGVIQKCCARRSTKRRTACWSFWSELP